MIQKFIDTNKLNNHIFLLGHINSQELANMYKVSNALILPSFSDPSPLTVIEALYMKLPIILSNRCGNHFEAVIENLNGYLFDPEISESIQKSFVSFLNNRVLWEKMGSESFDIYLKNFNRKDVVKNFVSHLNHS